MKLGADPEFICSDRKGVFLPANLINNQSGGFGCDGCAEVGEIRPQIANKAIDVVANIGAMIREATTLQELIKEGDILLFAGHFKHNHAIGGHIHISEIPVKGYEDYFYSYIDKILGTLSTIIDNKDEKDKRRNSGYGIGYRMQGDNYIEYRSPGSWLLSPSIAFMNMWLAEAVAVLYSSEQINPIDSFEKTKDGIIKFADVCSISDKKLFIKAAENIFSNLPIDWNVPFVENWL